MQKGTIEVKQGDITKLDVDAIVNAANRSLLGGGGVDGAIHRAAGPALLEECRMLHGCETGEAKITKGYKLPARHVIHTVGPVYSGKSKDSELLRNCYYNSMELAKENDLHSIAFPAISTGVYGYPKRDAAEIAVKTLQDWITENQGYEIRIILIGFDEGTCAIYRDLLG
ncbi:MAG: O-acetyl-ADP-ribose deacetylase [Lachnospiraceae bacterium]|nr:O-acetyl-ADP-ribose deacetylase [Lachnospiraceae bacterium]